MQLGQFKKLLREEVRKALQEVAAEKAYALVIQQKDGAVTTQDLKAYAKDYYYNQDGEKITLRKVLEKTSPRGMHDFFYPREYSTWNPNFPYSENAKKQLSKLSSTHDFYDTFDFVIYRGFIPLVAAIPKGKTPTDYGPDRAYVLFVDEDGYFKQDQLRFFEGSVNSNAKKIAADKAAKLPTEVDAWISTPQLAKAENKEWIQAIAKLGTDYDYYDALSDGTEKVLVAAVPKGKRLKSFL